MKKFIFSYSRECMVAKEWIIFPEANGSVWLIGWRLYVTVIFSPFIEFVLSSLLTLEFPEAFRISHCERLRQGNLIQGKAHLASKNWENLFGDQREDSLTSSEVCFLLKCKQISAYH